MKTGGRGWRTRALGWRTLAIALALLAPACKESPEEQKAYENKVGELAFNAGHFESSVQHYQKVLRLDPMSTTALNQIGRCYFNLGELEKAKRFFERSKSLDNRQVDVRLILALIALSRGRLADARHEARVVLDRQRANMDALMLFAECSVKPKDADEAIWRLERARDVLAKEARFHIALGKAYQRKKDLRSAERSFQTALRLEPDSVEAQELLGQVHVVKDDAKEAERGLKAAASLEPEGGESDIRLASFYVLTRRPELAKKVLLDLTEQLPNAMPPWRMLATIYFGERNWDEAERATQIVLNRKPKDIGALFLRARIHIGRGEVEAGIRRLHEMLDLEPDAFMVHFELAKALLLASKVEEAKTELGRVLELSPGFIEATLLLAAVNIRTNAADDAIAQLNSLLEKQPELAQAHEMLGAAFLHSKQPELATREFMRMASARPGDPRGAFLLGLTYLSRGDSAWARALFETAIAWQPDYVDPLRQLAGLAITNEGFDAAVALVRRQGVLAPASGELRYLLGKLYAMRRDTDEAEKAFCEAVQIDPEVRGARMELGSLYSATGRYEEALSHLEQLLEEVPNNVEVMVLIGSLYENTNRLRDAEKIYRRALGINPRSVSAANNLACLISEYGGDEKLAFELAQIAARGAPTDPRIADTFGWILYRKGDFAHAVAALTDAAGKLTDSPAVLYHLGMAQYRLGRYAEARQSLLKAMDLSSTFRGFNECQSTLAGLP